MSKSSEILVFLVDAEEVRVVATRCEKTSVEIIEQCSFWSRSRSEDNSPLTDQTVLDALSGHVRQKKWQGRELVCLLSGPAVSCQYFDMPPLAAAALIQAATLKLGQQLHFDLADATTDVRFIGKAGASPNGQTRVNGVAIRNAHTNAVVNISERLGLSLQAIAPASAALTALATEISSGSTSAEVVLNIDEKISTLVVLNAGVPCVASELAIGLADLTTALMRPIISGDEVVQLDETRATELRNSIGIPGPDQQIEAIGVPGSRILPLLEPLIQNFVKQITQWLSFAITSTGCPKPASFKIMGMGAAVPGLGKVLGARLNLQVQTSDLLSKMATLSAGSSPEQLEGLAAIVGAVRHRHELPNAIPKEFCRRRKIAQLRRAVTICAPVIAAGLFAWAMLFKSMDRSMHPALGKAQHRIAHMDRLVRENQAFVAERDQVKVLRKKLDGFAAGTPRWEGVFKELSMVLPGEVQATELQADSQSEGIRLVLLAKIFPGGQRHFDEIVEQTLISLQRSPFFSHVQLVNSNREQNPNQPGLAGLLTVELELNYSRKAEPKA